MFILIKIIDFLLRVQCFVSVHLFNCRTHPKLLTKVLWLIIFGYDTHYMWP